MGQTVACANQKGGVGKTTTVVNLGSYLALAGDRVLVVDLDPQGNATSGLGIDRATIDRSVYQAVIDGVLVNGSVGALGWFAGRARWIQSGFLYSYAFWMIVGLVLLLGWFLFRV